MGHVVSWDMCGNLHRVEALGDCQATIALYTERITEDAQPLFPINSLRNQVQRFASKQTTRSI